MVLSLAKNYAAPFIGMTFFWAYFRYQSFFGLLYPLKSGSSLYPVLLVMLLVLCIFAIPARRHIENVLLSRRFLIPLVGVCGSVGVAVGIFANEGLFEPWLSWVSLLLVAICFISSYFAWALYFCNRFGPEEVVMLAASYMASLLIFAHGSSSLVAVAVPAGAGICWRLAPLPKTIETKSKLSSLKEVTPYAVLFVAFLLAGSVLRGIVDATEVDASGPTFRWPLSLLVSGFALAGCLLFFRGQKKAESGSSNASRILLYQSIEAMTLKAWAALALIFFAAIFAGLFEGSYTLSGHVVVVARSTLDFLLWVVLCNLVFSKKLSPVLVFTVFSILTNVVSWMLSYVVLPDLLTLQVGDDRMQTVDVFVLLAAFVLLAFIILVFGAVSSKRQSVTGRDVDTTLRVSSPFISEDIALECKLTSREVEVATLFAQGHSMKKVATMLYISTSTAQSHIKSAYRKLGVHSKDELIERLSG